ncbi:TIR domain-containing protein [Paraburkholderia phytofirmans]|uniref:TIR domain-containing protein n=1 Tax=Paraburkholderia phytofirmans TaxID=261302 RepID=UPI0038BBB8D2
MSVFISWSKPTAKSVAVELKHIVEMCLGAYDVKAWMSDIDIPKGGRWSSEVAKQLEQTSVGIICVTRENLHEPWLYFEAGALSKSVAEAKVHPLLIGVDANSLPGPISQFQATLFDKRHMLDLLLTIARDSTAKQIRESQVGERFERVWAALESAAVPAFAFKQPVHSSGQTDPRVAQSDVDLKDDEVRILKFLIEAGSALPVEGLARATMLHTFRIEHVLNELESRHIVGKILNISGPTRYYLADLGKRIAVDRNWV